MFSTIFPKSLSRYFLTALIGCSILGLSSCDDEESAPKDTSAPVVTFSSLTANRAVWNNVDVDLAVTDNDNIKTVEVYVDGTLVKTLTTTPYEYVWDSNAVPDGNRILKVVATDMAGNKSEAQVTVVVKNTLVTIDVSNDEVINTEEYAVRKFIVLSDEDGDVVTHAEVENGKKLELKSPSFNGEKFYVSEVLYTREGSFEGWNESDVFTFAGVERGKWFLFTEGAYVDNSTQANLSFQNAESGKTYMLSSNYDNLSRSSESGSFAQTLYLMPSPSPLFIQRSELGIPDSYRLIQSITTGANTAVDLSQGWQALSPVTSTVPEGFEEVYAYLWGYPNAENTDERNFLGESRYNQAENKLIINRPGDAFPLYSLNYSFVRDNYYVSKSTNTFNMSFSPITHTLDAETNATGFHVTSTGAFDFSLLYFGKTDYNTEWMFVIPTNWESAVVAPKMPDEIKALMDVPVFDFSGATGYVLYEHGAFDSYSEWLDALRDSQDGLEGVGTGTNMEFTYMEVYLGDGEGGRKPAPSFKKSLNGWLKTSRKK